MSFTVHYTVGGGTPDYVVTLNGSTKSPNTHVVDGTYTFTDVPEGTYIVESIDSNGCVLSDPITLIATEIPTPSPSCQLVSFIAETTSADFEQSNGTITVTNLATDIGNITYSINGIGWQSSNVFGGLIAGTYTVYVNDDVVTGCLITGLTTIFTIFEPTNYTISFSNVGVVSGDGGGEGTPILPYDSGVVLDFNVKGNGGVGGIFPSTYTISVRQLTVGDDSIGVNYITGGYVDGEFMTIQPPRGTLTNNTEINSFNGDMGCIEATNHSVEFFNATIDGTVYIELVLYLNGVLVDSFGKYISDGGSVPPLC